MTAKAQVVREIVCTFYLREGGGIKVLLKRFLWVNDKTPGGINIDLSCFPCSLRT